MSINSPGDYLVHNPAGRYAAEPQLASAAQASLPAPAAKSRGLWWRRLVQGSLRRR